MEKYLFWALLVAFAAYAARIGLALSGMGLKQLAITLTGYFAVFALSFSVAKFIAAKYIINAAKYAVYFHLAVAVGLIVWSFISWGRKDRKHSSYLLLLPCPFCLLTIFFSIYTASILIEKPLWFVATSAYAIFALDILIFFFLGKVLRISPWEVMTGAGIYYILLLAGSRYYEDFKKVYSMAAKGTYTLPAKSLWLGFLLIVTIIAGMLRGMRTHG